MSRTKKTQNKNIMDQRRHGIVRRTTSYPLSELTKLAKASGGKLNLEKFFNSKFAGLDGPQRVQKIAEEARTFLKEQSLPVSDLVFFDPGTLEIASSEERALVEEKIREGGQDWHNLKFSFATLEKFLEKRGYNFFDDEIIFARIIRRADIILNPETPRDRLIDQVLKFGNDVALLDRFRAADARARYGGRASKLKQWAFELAKETISKNPEASARKMWERFPEFEETEDEPNFVAGGRRFVVYRDGARLVAKNDETGHEESISERTWRDYLKKAKG